MTALQPVISINMQGLIVLRWIFSFFYLQLVPWSRLQNFHQRLLQNRALRLEWNYFIELFFLKNFIWGPLSKIINKNQ